MSAPVAPVAPVTLDTLDRNLSQVWADLYAAQKAAEALGDTKAAGAFQRAHLLVNSAACELINLRREREQVTA